MDMQERIQQDLPNFPPDVLEQWLVPFAEDCGWPPEAPRWKYLLRNPNLEYWRNVTWKLEKISLEAINYSDSAKSQVVGLLQAYVQNIVNIYSVELGVNGKERFKYQLDYLQTNSVFIRPPVLVDHGEGYEIMDGSHRITAYFADRSLGDKSLAKPVQPVWLCNAAT